MYNNIKNYLRICTSTGSSDDNLHNTFLFMYIYKIKFHLSSDFTHTLAHTSNIHYTMCILFFNLTLTIIIIITYFLFYFFYPERGKTSANRRKAGYVVQPGQPYNLNVFQTSPTPAITSNYPCCTQQRAHSQRVCSRFYFFLQRVYIIVCY